jgi:hypothetical protein
LKIPSIKKLVESASIPDLRAAEDSILEGNIPAIIVEGDDEGEQLTHVLAAIEIKHAMEHHKQDFMTALRSYTQRVRTSIS